jgi:WD40 repeat protein
VYVFEWATKRKRKLLSCLDTGGSSVSHLRFSRDGKLLFVQAGAPDLSLRVIAWEKTSGGRVMGTLTAASPGHGKPVSALELCPESSTPGETLFVVTGRTFVRLFKYLEGSFKAVNVNLKRDPVTAHYTAAAWLAADRLVVATAGGEVQILVGGELMRTLDVPAEEGPGVMLNAGGVRAISCLVPFSKGFLAGCEGGVVRVFERSEDPRMPYKATRSLTVPPTDVSPVLSLALSPNEEDIVVTVGSGQAYSFRFGAFELHRSSASASVSPFHPLMGPVHTLPSAAPEVTGGEGHKAASVLAAATGKVRGFADVPVSHQGITGLALCLRKPLFATCGADRTVRVWNFTGMHIGVGVEGGGLASHGTNSGAAAYEATPVLELIAPMKETPTAVALHPAGHLIAIGLETSVQLCALVLGAAQPVVKPLKDFPLWAAASMHFSYGGSMLAIGAGTMVVVVSTWTGATIATLRGHADKVVAVAWSRDDKCLITASRDGVVFRWAVVVPNAAVGGAPLVVGGPGLAQPVAGALATDRRSSSSSSAVSGPSLVGTVLGRVELKDFTPLALVVGSSDRDAFVSGVNLVSSSKGAPNKAPPSYVPSIRHVMLDTVAGREMAASSGGVRIAEAAGESLAAHDADGAVKAEPDLASVRALGILVGAKLLVAGMGVRLAAAAAPPAAPTTSGTPASPKRAGAIAGGSSSPGTANAAGRKGHAGAEALHVSLSRNAMDASGHVRLMRLPGAAPAPGAGHGAAHDDADGGVVEDVACHAGPVLHVAVSRDERFMVTAGADGSLAVWRVEDGGDRSGGVSTGSTTAAPAWSDSILVPKSDLEAFRRDKADLEARIADTTVANMREEHTKAEANAARLEELRMRFEEETASARARTTDLVRAKSSMEEYYEATLSTLAKSQAKELEDLETVYSSKLGGEIARYDRLVADRDRSATDSRATASTTSERHASNLAELRQHYAAASEQETAHVSALESERAGLAEEAAKAADGLERDGEGEITSFRARYEMRLASEGKATLLLRGENGFMKRKFVSVSREISDHKDEMSALADKEKELTDAIANLTKDVAGHKKEIREREDTVADKDARIYELKKKNQELEKFKFVLNYKIQELKRQIMPRKKEIADMREQLKEMELELLQYHKSNAALDLMIGELKLKRDGMARDVDVLGSSLGEANGSLASIARDLIAVTNASASAASSAGEAGAASASLKSLRSSMVSLYAKYVHGEAGGMRLAMAGLSSSLRTSAAEGKDGGGLIVPAGVNVEELAEELARQKHYLERNVDSLSRKMAADGAAAAGDFARLLRENTSLTEELNDLRRDLRYAQVERDGARLDNSTGGLGASKSGLLNATGAGASLRRTGALHGIVAPTAGHAASAIGIVISVGKPGSAL